MLRLNGVLFLDSEGKKVVLEQEMPLGTIYHHFLNVQYGHLLNFGWPPFWNTQKQMLYGSVVTNYRNLVSSVFRCLLGKLWPNTTIGIGTPTRIEWRRIKFQKDNTVTFSLSLSKRGFFYIWKMLGTHNEIIRKCFIRFEDFNNLWTKVLWKKKFWKFKINFNEA